MQIIQNGDIALHVLDQGPRDGRVIVFGNSLGTDFRIWDLLLPLLPEGLRIVRFDKRGHGLSDCPPSPYAVDDLVGDAVCIIETLGLQDVTYVGLSIGGLIGQGLAVSRPDLLKALVLMDTSAKTGTQQMWQDRIDALVSGGFETMRPALMERWFTADFRNDPVKVSPWSNMATRTPMEGYVGCCHAIGHADMQDALVEAKPGMPVMAMVGDEDSATTPEMVQATADLFGAPCHIINNAGHIPCVEQPQQVADLITAFLRETI